MKLLFGASRQNSGRKNSRRAIASRDLTLSPAVRCSPLLSGKKMTKIPFQSLSNGGTDLPFVVAGRIRFQRGLDPEVLENFPTLVYSDVKEHKIGKGALECAICLNEFEDDETIRLLPECDHVFHQECVDAWLETHVTCPVCSANYTFYSPDRASRIPARNDGAMLALAPPASALPPDAPPADHVVITVDDMNERKEEMRELTRIASKVRANGPRRSKRISRSHSTGHSMMPQGEAGLDRFRLRLPENMRKEIIAAGKLHRSRTFAVTVTGGGAGESSTLPSPSPLPSQSPSLSDTVRGFYGRLCLRFCLPGRLALVFAGNFN
ncbi:E3 ubiquitin-protein ligase ATL6-like [Dendrobium catenatum]|uniref:E3 ubiquitin-protein ligase ATL6-like n=1 Tax=Dendrobium catenatum TaxID=906689 RepID=UPI00109F51C4|nr:E3 ubiquitin-protein ligase ATL6-like [Dendrobium catenatum]